MKYLFYPFFIALLVGCATSRVAPVAPVAGESLEPLKTQKIAVSYLLASKRINYVETVYRVLWLETNSSSSDYSGIWSSADADMTDMVVARLRQQGYTAQPVQEIVDPLTLEAADQELARETLGNSVGGGSTRPAPSLAFFRQLKASGAHAAMLKELRDKGYRYFLELNAMNLSGLAIGYGSVMIGSAPRARIIDLERSKVVWLSPVNHAQIYQLGGDLKKLEVDDMKKTKEGLKAGINKIDFTTLWGLGRG